MKRFLLRATILLAGGLATAGLASNVHAAPITFNFDTGSNENLGSTQTYTSAGASVTAYGGSRNGTSVSRNQDLYSNHNGFDERGLGICSSPSGRSDNCRDSTEINGTELVQLDLKNLIDTGYNKFSINADSSTGGEILAVYYSTSSNLLGTFAANITSALGDVVVTTAGARYLNFISGTNPDRDDVILNSLTADKVAVSEPASLALLGSAMLGAGLIRRRQSRA